MIGALFRAWRETVGRWLRVGDMRLIAAFLLLCLLLRVFVELGEEALEPPGRVDDEILLALRDPDDRARGIGGPFVEGAARDITGLGSGTVVALVACAAIGWFLVTRRLGDAVFVLVAVLGGWFLSDRLKDVFERERPTIVPHLVDASSWSFPSGHTMISAVLYPTIAALLGRLVLHQAARMYLMALGIGVTVLVGLTRIYLGVHYPSDVLGGLASGSAWALVCGTVAHELQRHHVLRRHPGPSRGAIGAR